jgi:hypothetical protein
VPASQVEASVRDFRRTFDLFGVLTVGVGRHG